MHLSGRGSLINLAILLFCIFVPEPGKAAWSTDSAANNPVTAAPYSQYHYRHQIAPDGSGGVFVIWDHYDAGGFAGIYGQHLDANGNPTWSPADGKPIVTATGYWFDLSGIVSDYNGGAFITLWDSRNYETSDYDVYAQRIDADGNPMWGTGGVAVCTANGEQAVERMLSSDEPGLYMLWSDHRNDPIETDYYFQWLDGDGNAQFITDGIPICTAIGSQVLADMAVIGDSGIVAVWEDDRYLGSLGLSRLYAQRIYTSGTMWTTNGVAISSVGDWQTAPHVVSNYDNYAIVAWDAHASLTAEWGIFAQKLEPISGVGVWTPGGILITDTTNSCNNSKLLADGQAGAYLTWTDARAVAPGLYAQRLAWNGAFMWNPTGVPVLTNGFLESSFFSGKMVQSFNQDVMIIWHDDRDYGTTGNDIYAQRIGFDGTPRWTINGIPICTAVRNQANADAITDGSGGLIAVWQDDRAPLSADRPDIYAQQVGWTGALGVVTSVGRKNASVPVSLQLEQNSPNPFGEVTRFGFVLPRESDVRVDVYNIAGQRVATHTLSSLSAGVQTFSLSARDNRGNLLPSGVYFYRVTAGRLMETKKMVVLR